LKQFSLLREAIDADPSNCINGGYLILSVFLNIFENSDPLLITYLHYLLNDYQETRNDAKDIASHIFHIIIYSVILHKYFDCLY